jgi:hypothetical protein
MDQRRNAAKHKRQPEAGAALPLPARGIEPLESRKHDGRSKAVQDYRVLIDLPVPLPVTDAELDLLERELGSVVAELLKAPC